MSDVMSQAEVNAILYDKEKEISNQLRTELENKEKLLRISTQSEVRLAGENKRLREALEYISTYKVDELQDTASEIADIAIKALEAGGE